MVFCCFTSGIICEPQLSIQLRWYFATIRQNDVEADIEDSHARSNKIGPKQQGARGNWLLQNYYWAIWFGNVNLGMIR